MADIKQLGIVVDDGLQRVPITNLNGDEIGVFTFRPTDLGIIQRYNKIVQNWDHILEPLDSLSDGADVDTDENTAHNIEALEIAKQRLYEAVNELFGGDMAGAFFGKMDPFSPVKGVFYCWHAIEAVGQFINQQFDAETAKFEKRVSKYTKGVKRGK